MRKKIIKLIASLGLLGYSRVAPGTTGALAAAALYIFIKGDFMLLAIAAFVFIAVGFLVSGRAEAIFGEKDARRIVIDDASGLLIALFGLSFSLQNLAIVFLIYRTIDIIKPFPIRRIERLAGSPGIMLDDVAAGIYTNLTIRLVYYLGFLAN